MVTRTTVIALLTLWPIGLLLVVANMEVAEISAPVFLALDIGYLCGSLLLLRQASCGRDRIATILVLSGVGLFFIVGFTGIPTADEPDLMMLNTAALLGAALTLNYAVVALVWRRRHSPVMASVLPMIVMVIIGTTLYIANLLARFAVVFSGAAPRQVAVEDKAWVAYEYLRGLTAPPDFMGYALVWLDLLQLAYVVCAFLGFAAISRLLRGQFITDRVGRIIQVAGNGLAAIIVIGVGCAAVLPREFDAVPAWAVFVAGIPFMTTLLPFVLGVALLRGTALAPHRHNSQLPADTATPSSRP